MYIIFYKTCIDDYVIFGICLMASKSARMRGSAHLKAVTVAHQKSYVMLLISATLGTVGVLAGFP